MGKLRLWWVTTVRWQLQWQSWCPHFSTSSPAPHSSFLFTITCYDKPGIFKGCVISCWEILGVAAKLDNWPWSQPGLEQRQSSTACSSKNQGHPFEKCIPASWSCSKGSQHKRIGVDGDRETLVGSWGSNPGTHACCASAFLLSYTLSPQTFFFPPLSFPHLLCLKYKNLCSLLRPIY